MPSVSVVDEPAATAFVGLKSAVPGSTVTTEPGVIVGGAAGVGRVDRPSRLLHPIDHLHHLDGGILAFMNVQVTVSPVLTLDRD